MTTLHRSRRGTALQVLMAMVAAGAVTWMGISSVTSSWPGAPRGQRLKFRSPPTAFEVEAALGELGLSPQVLAASGFSAQQTALFTSAAAGYLREHMPDYRAAQDAVFQARKEVDRLTRLVQGGAATEQEVVALRTATTTLATAQSNRTAILNAAMNEGTGAASGQPAVALAAFRTNTRQWDLPVQYLGDNRSAADWLALRDAVANDRIAARENVEPDPASHQLLLNAQQTPAAAAALANLAHVADIQAAWTQAIGP